MTQWFKPPWLALAEQELGVSEVVGPADNPRILAYWQIAHLQHENLQNNELTSWCGCFVAAMLTLAAVKPWGDAAARSWGKIGGGIRLTKPVYGCVGVKKRNGGLAWQGHTGFVVAVSPDGSRICLLAGNQGDKVSYAWFNALDFTGAAGLGFFWPKDAPFPPVLDAPRIAPGTPVQTKEA